MLGFRVPSLRRASCPGAAHKKSFQLSSKNGRKVQNITAASWEDVQACTLVQYGVTDPVLVDSTGSVLNDIETVVEDARYRVQERPYARKVKVVFIPKDGSPSSKEYGIFSKRTFNAIKNEFKSWAWRGKDGELVIEFPDIEDNGAYTVHEGSNPLLASQVQIIQRQLDNRVKAREETFSRTLLAKAESEYPRETSFSRFYSREFELLDRHKCELDAGVIIREKNGTAILWIGEYKSSLSYSDIQSISAKSKKIQAALKSPKPSEIQNYCGKGTQVRFFMAGDRLADCKIDGTTYTASEAKEELEQQNIEYALLSGDKFKFIGEAC